MFCLILFYPSMQLFALLLIFVNMFKKLSTLVDVAIFFSLCISIFRSSRPEVFYKDGVLKKTRKIHRKIRYFTSLYYKFLNRRHISKAVAQRCSVKKIFLEISQNSQEDICAKVSFLIKLQVQACNLIKKDTLAQAFSCEFCEISKNTYFHRAPLVVASDI